MARWNHWYMDDPIPCAPAVTPAGLSNSDEDKSTHSSLPDLIAPPVLPELALPTAADDSDSDSGTHSSMPELVQGADTDTSDEEETANESVSDVSETEEQVTSIPMVVWIGSGHDEEETRDMRCLEHEDVLLSSSHTPSQYEAEIEPSSGEDDDDDNSSSSGPSDVDSSN